MILSEFIVEMTIYTAVLALAMDKSFLIAGELVPAGDEVCLRMC